MEENTKKGRAKKVHNYKFSDQTVNLNGYVAVCTKTGNEKRFYHSYLANMIVKKFDNNNSGGLKINEFIKAWKFLGLKGSFSEIHCVFEKVDIDRSILIKREMGSGGRI